MSFVNNLRKLQINVTNHIVQGFPGTKLGALRTDPVPSACISASRRRQGRPFQHKATWGRRGRIQSFRRVRSLRLKVRFPGAARYFLKACKYSLTDSGHRFDPSIEKKTNTSPKWEIQEKDNIYLALTYILLIIH